ncbi:hypothetical protein CLI84_09860 [Porphyromonas gingivalis]|nr:hypothetical protein CLI84_09860 [Porphyromonas gingivalis]
MQPVSIMGKHLNNFERLSILEDYLSGSDSKVAIEQKYGLSHGLIRSWLSKFGLEDKVHPVPMKVSQSPQSELTLNEKEELEQLRSRPLRVLLLSDIEQISLRKPLINLQVFLSLWQETCRFS